VYASNGTKDTHYLCSFNALEDNASEAFQIGNIDRLGRFLQGREGEYCTVKECCFVDPWFFRHDDQDEAKRVDEV